MSGGEILDLVRRERDDRIRGDHAVEMALVLLAHWQQSHSERWKREATWLSAACVVLGAAGCNERAAAAAEIPSFDDRVEALHALRIEARPTPRPMAV